MQRHAHSIATQRRDHTGRITDHQHMILNLVFPVKGYTGNCKWFCIEKPGIGKDIFQERIFLEDVFLHRLDIIVAFTQIPGGGKVTKAVFIMLDP